MNRKKPLGRKMIAAAKRERLLIAARKLAVGKSWVDLSNALIDPEEGILAKAYTTKDERKKFTNTEEYREIVQLVWDAFYDEKE